MTRRARVLIVDDHPIFRRGLRELIADEPDLEVCCEAADSGEALRYIHTCPPDVPLIDLTLKGGHGLELIEEIKQQNDQVRMLVCSMHPETDFAERALRAGAMGYVNKEEAADKIVEAIHQVLRGEIYLSGSMAKRLLQSLVGGKPDEQDPVETLTNREMEVFQLIGQGYTTKQIARRLDLSPKTIETHREKIKTKLDLANSQQLSHRAFQWVHDRA